MKTDEGLIRAVGVRALTAAIINFTVGAGIFVLPAVVAGKIGNAAPIAYVVCGVAMALIVSCFASAGSRVSLTGGTYAYAEVAFGPYVGFMVAMLLWFGSNVMASAAVVNVFVDSLAQFVPSLANKAVKDVVIVAVYGGLAVLNIRGVKIGSRVVQTVTVAKILPLLILVAFGFFAIISANLTWPSMPPVADLARTSTVLIFAFLGVESALTPSGEVKDPARTVPRSIFLALLITTVLYIAIQVVSQGILGAELATNTKAPLAEAAGRALGSAGKSLVLIGAAISTFGYVAGDMLASPRGVYALGRDGLLPAMTSRINKKFATPHVAIIVHAVFCAAFALSGTFVTLLIVSVLAALTVYVVCCLATIQLQRKNVRAEGATPFNVPGGPVVPILATAMVLWLMSSSTKQEFLAMAAMVAVLTVLFFAMRMRRTSSPTLS
ncbi:MAG: amino acid permease [Gemmatimonadales bacterium]